MLGDSDFDGGDSWLDLYMGDSVDHDNCGGGLNCSIKIM